MNFDYEKLIFIHYKKCIKYEFSTYGNMVGHQLKFVSSKQSCQFPTEIEAVYFNFVHI